MMTNIKKKMMCCTNASENKHKEELAYRRLQTNNESPVFRKKFGGETEQNPNDPKYQKMAQEIVFNHMRLRKQDVKKNIVAKVTTQVVSGVITRIKLRILLYSGNTLTCDSTIAEQPWQKIKNISYTCTDANYSGQKLKSSGERQYQHNGKAAVVKYFKDQPGKHEIVDIKLIDTDYIKTRQLKKKIMYMKYDVIVRRSDNYECTVVFVLTSYDYLSTNCIVDNDNIAGGYRWVDPTKEKYLDLAEKSMLNPKSVSHKLTASDHDTIVTFALLQVVSGFKYTIKFIIYTVNGPKKECQTVVWEKKKGKVIYESVDCNPRSNQTEPSNKDENKYNGLGKTSVKSYFQNLPGNLKIVDIKIKNIATVTTQVVKQEIMYINFEVIVRSSNNYICSVLFVIPSTDSLSTNCIEVTAKPGGFQWNDPSENKYVALAEKATNQNSDAMVYDVIVTFVVKQAVAGSKDRIEFIARPVHTQEYQCRTNVWEKTTGENIIKDITCHLRKNNKNISDTSNFKK